MKYAIFAFLMFLVACKPSSEQLKNDQNVISVEAATKEINQVLLDQQNAWNEGDIPKFMEGYWKSEKLTFIGRSGVNKGWQTTLDNYKKGYPDKATMGELQFEVLELNQLSNEVYRMIGRYTLIRKEDKPTGIFTLIWQLIDGNWVITSDQTCG